MKSEIDASPTALRFNVGKIRYELIPTHLLEPAMLAMAYLHELQGPWEWSKGMPWSKVIGCMKRHLAAVERGEDIDEESGLPHMGHLMCNALMLEHYRLMYPEGDDRPTWFGNPVPESERFRSFDSP